MTEASKDWLILKRITEVASVILPMVLQIGETMVLQRVELDEKASSSHVWAFWQLVALMGKHGFAEKLHLKSKWILMKPELFQMHFQQMVRSPGRLALRPGVATEKAQGGQEFR